MWWIIRLKNFNCIVFRVQSKKVVLATPTYSPVCESMLWDGTYRSLHFLLFYLFLMILWCTCRRTLKSSDFHWCFFFSSPTELGIRTDYIIDFYNIQVSFFLFQKVSSWLFLWFISWKLNFMKIFTYLTSIWLH